MPDSVTLFGQAATLVDVLANDVDPTGGLLVVQGGEADEVTVRADAQEFRARLRLDTPREREYFRHGGILQFVPRRLLSE